MTLDELRFAVIVIAALGCGLIAGVFFAFSSFVMDALKRLPPAQGIAAMQSINVKAVRPAFPFLTVFLGTAAVCALLAVSALSSWERAGSLHLLSGSLVYLAGTFVVTMAANVPLNDELAHVDPASEEGARLWARYLSRWTAWNHVRTATSLLGAALLTLALTR
jgi:uncharacterized membrane protein